MFVDMHCSFSATLSTPLNEFQPKEQTVTLLCPQGRVHRGVSTVGHHEVNPPPGTTLQNKRCDVSQTETVDYQKLQQHSAPSFKHTAAIFYIQAVISADYITPTTLISACVSTGVHRPHPLHLLRAHLSITLREMKLVLLTCSVLR